MRDGVASPKPVESRDHVVIRFAGDSGDGMQVTGTQFTTRVGAGRQRPRDAARLPAEIRAPAARSPASALPAELLVRRGLHARRRPRRAGRDEPGGAARRTSATSSRRHADRRSRGLQRAEPAEGGYATNPLEDGSLAGYQVFQADVTKLTTAR
jgi:2-oxoglutarate ferredoxin oxidoreductase subunit alpha